MKEIRGNLSIRKLFLKGVLDFRIFDIKNLIILKVFSEY